ncbi:MAG: hypothetical protein VXB01_09830, partial [Opitutae bacterium]
MNPLVTTALASTGQKIIEHCLSSPESEKSKGGTFDGVLAQKLHNDFETEYKTAPASGRPNY